MPPFRAATMIAKAPLGGAQCMVCSPQPCRNSWAEGGSLVGQRWLDVSPRVLQRHLRPAGFLACGCWVQVRSARRAPNAPIVVVHRPLAVWRCGIGRARG